MCLGRRAPVLQEDFRRLRSDVICFSWTAGATGFQSVRTGVKDFRVTFVVKNFKLALPAGRLRT